MVKKTGDKKPPKKNAMEKKETTAKTLVSLSPNV